MAYASTPRVRAAGETHAARCVVCVCRDLRGIVEGDPLYTYSTYSILTITLQKEQEFIYKIVSKKNVRMWKRKPHCHARASTLEARSRSTK